MGKFLVCWLAKGFNSHIAIMNRFLLVLLLFSASEAAFAACGGSSPNRVAASASRADVLDCANAATSGDRITVPAGTATWSTPIGLPGSKDLTVAGASVVTCSGTPITCSAINNTNITCSSGHCFTIDLAASHRITGFTMLNANDGGIVTEGENQNPNKHFRIDHNRIVSSGGWAPMEFWGRSSGGLAAHPQGIVDNNILVDIAIHVNGTRNTSYSEGPQQHILWAQQTPLGDSTAVVYIEDNHFQNTSGNINNADSSYGGRYVFRFNNTTSGRQTAEVHGNQDDHRGSQRTEIYKNSGSNPSGFSGTVFFRGGSGVVWGNRLSAGWPSFGILFDVDRAESSGSPCGRCSGASACDQNSSGRSGSLCRDQVGIARDVTQWSHSPIGAWNQVVQPVYMWDNLTGTGQMNVDSQVSASYIAANREYYTQVTSFTGTTGVGVGPIASRPSTCTTGVGYWATNEGNWNSRVPAGTSGRLYRCTATNTWTLHYTPNTYPHQWTAGSGGGGGVATLPAPANLRVVP